jgi:hypothetical protein
MEKGSIVWYANTKENVQVSWFATFYGHTPDKPMVDLLPW